MIAPGTILQNRYLVEEQIGQGGMGAVFVATDQRFGSRVALKETFFTDPNLRKAFEREARLLNRLRHHALPRVSDHFTEEEGQFLVMEYIPGDDLSEMLKKRGEPFPIHDVLSCADQLLDALDYLHTQEPPVIHRDIKPQNLKVTARNQIVLLDFGLAKGTPLQSRVTATGSVLGYSLNYAPLEQMQGAGTDPRSDLYSMGATLHHLMTGETPPDALTRATAVLNGEEDPLRPASEIHAQVSAAVAAVLTRAMSQSAGRRFATAAEMREALREAARDLPAEAHAIIAPLKTPTPVSEQETRLMTEPGTAHAPRGAGMKETGVNNQPEAPTPTEAARTAHVAPQATQATPHAPTSVPDKASASTGARDEESVVTSVRAPREQAAAAAKGGARSRRTVGVAAGVVAAALVAAAVYAFTRPDTQREPPPTATQPATVNATPSPEAQPAANAAASPQTAEAASPTPAPAPQQQQPAPRRTGAATTARDASNTNRAGRGVNVVVAPNAPRPPDGLTEEDMRELREAQSLSNRNFGPSQEELREILRRSEDQRRRAIQIRRENERQRRRQRIVVPQPPTPEP